MVFGYKVINSKFKEEKISHGIWLWNDLIVNLNIIK